MNISNKNHNSYLLTDHLIVYSHKFTFFVEYFLITSVLFLLLAFCILRTNFLPVKNNLPKFFSELVGLLFFLSIYLIRNDDIVLNDNVNFFEVMIQDYLGVFGKITICFFSGIYFFIISDSLKEQKLNSFEYIILLLLAVFGLILLCSCNDLITAYLAIELTSFSSYILAAFRKDSTYSIDAGIKYFIVGSISSAFFLFGTSIIYAFCGSVRFSDMHDLFFYHHENSLFIKNYAPTDIRELLPFIKKAVVSNDTVIVNDILRNNTYENYEAKKTPFLLNKTYAYDKYFKDIYVNIFNYLKEPNIIEFDCEWDMTSSEHFLKLLQPEIALNLEKWKVALLLENRVNSAPFKELEKHIISSFKEASLFDSRHYVLTENKLLFDFLYWEHLFEEEKLKDILPVLVEISENPNLFEKINTADIKTLLEKSQNYSSAILKINFLKVEKEAILFYNKLYFENLFDARWEIVVDHFVKTTKGQKNDFLAMSKLEDTFVIDNLTKLRKELSNVEGDKLFLDFVFWERFFGKDVWSNLLPIIASEYTLSDELAFVDLLEECVSESKWLEFLNFLDKENISRRIFEEMYSKILNNYKNNCLYKFETLNTYEKNFFYFFLYWENLFGIDLWQKTLPFLLRGKIPKQEVVLQIYLAAVAAYKVHSFKEFKNLPLFDQQLFLKYLYWEQLVGGEKKFARMLPGLVKPYHTALYYAAHSDPMDFMRPLETKNLTYIFGETIFGKKEFYSDIQDALAREKDLTIFDSMHKIINGLIEDNRLIRAPYTSSIDAFLNYTYQEKRIGLEKYKELLPLLSTEFADSTIFKEISDCIIDFVLDEYCKNIKQVSKFIKKDDLVQIKECARLEELFGGRNTLKDLLPYLATIDRLDKDAYENICKKFLLEIEQNQSLPTYEQFNLNDKDNPNLFKSIYCAFLNAYKALNIKSFSAENIEQNRIFFDFLYWEQVFGSEKLRKIMPFLVFNCIEDSIYEDLRIQLFSLYKSDCLRNLNTLTLENKKSFKEFLYWENFFGSDSWANILAFIGDERNIDSYYTRVTYYDIFDFLKKNRFAYLKDLRSFDKILFLHDWKEIFNDYFYIDDTPEEIVFQSNDYLKLIETCIVIVVVSIFIKLALAPFHAWSLDVYEGSPTSSTFFFAVMTKLSFFIFIVRLCHFTSFPFKETWQMYSSWVAILSVLVGSFGGLRQTKIKTLFAYSSISHMGYLLFAFMAGSYFGLKMLFFYMFIYMITGICLWYSLILLRLKGRKDKYSKDLGDLILLKNSNPALASSLTLSIFSTAGIPPLIGFLTKLGVFLSLLDESFYFACLIAVLCSVISTFYYIKIIKIMYFENVLVGKLYHPIKNNKTMILSFMTFLLVFLFIEPNFLFLLIDIIFFNCMYK